MINTFIFDLDGTLLPMDMEVFLNKYFSELSIKFKDLFSQKELTAHVWASTTYMIKNKDPLITNEEAFFSDFYKRISYGPEIISPLFEDFYINDFKRIMTATRQEVIMVEAIKLLKEKGYKVVIATNPIFPELAINQRVQWGGFSIQDFEFITSFEKMHFCKPHLEFYHEVLDKVGKNPDECMMVGNDVEEDMVAKKLGIQTYLIEDCIICRENNKENIDFMGTYKDFFEFITSLPEVL